jgi:3-deoxy-D-manno-octulosonic-acid transferase
MILFLYNVGLLLALIVSAPWWLWQMATTRKYRKGLGERLGRIPAGRLSCLKPDSEQRLDAADARPVIWLHAVSVGEVLAVSRLVAELDSALPEFQLLISTTTRTGQALARERFGAGRVFYCPLDLPWAVRAYLNVLKPVMLILAETEFWPNLLSGCYRRQIPVVVVNARISDRSWPRYLRLRRMWRPFLRRLTAVLAQSQIDADRLLKLGCQPERVSVSGNLKFDIRATTEAEATRLIRAISGTLRLVVAGSTVEGEESLLLDAWMAIVASASDTVLVLAPRHPERFDSVAKLVERAGFPWRKRSATGQAPLNPGEIVLLDSIGELASIYSLATAAFIGGSLVKAGGHNPLEPAQFGVPVVMGNHYANFAAIVETMLIRNAIRIVSPANVGEEILRLLNDPVLASEVGSMGKQVFEREAGATKLTVKAIQQTLRLRGTQ